MVAVVGQAELSARWGPVGPAIVAAGYHGVQAFPLRWQGLVLGGLNVFYPTAEVSGTGTGQLLADVATLILATTTPHDVTQVQDNLRRALAGRIILEQAKGVLAHQHDTDPDQAFDLLRQRAHDAGTTLTRTAEDVVRAAQRGSSGQAPATSGEAG